jgi:hypothetical protein
MENFLSKKCGHAGGHPRCFSVDVDGFVEPQKIKIF